MLVFENRNKYFILIFSSVGIVVGNATTFSEYFRTNRCILGRENYGMWLQHVLHPIFFQVVFEVGKRWNGKGKQSMKNISCDKNWLYDNHSSSSKPNLRCSFLSRAINVDDCLFLVVWNIAFVKLCVIKNRNFFILILSLDK